VDDAQNFKIVADTNNLTNYSIIGSVENDLFKEYSIAVNKIGGELTAIENKFKTSTTAADSALYRTQYISKDKELKEQRTSFMKAHPKSMMSYLLNVMQRPEAPAIPVINGKADSLYPYYYVKNHFWDNVVFNDNRLIRTPFFEAKLDEYFKNYVARDADSIIEEVQYMLTVAKTGKEIYPFLLFKFTNKYISPEFMGQDKVFLHLYQIFFAKGDTVLLNDASKKSITERAYSMMANQLGLAAPALDINTIDDKPFSLYKTAAPYIFIAFWDPTCSHCKVEIPQLDSIYKASWKKLGVQIVGVNINYKEIPAWKKFLSENKIDNWFHVYQTEAALNKEITNQKPTTIRQLYDVFKTPTYYLLDANKRIIAKNLSLQQFDDFLKSKAKK
jgi:thiol-disulfide isomerase/thioredoxin